MYIISTILVACIGVGLLFVASYSETSNSVAARVHIYLEYHPESGEHPVIIVNNSGYELVVHERSGTKSRIGQGLVYIDAKPGTTLSIFTKVWGIQLRVAVGYVPSVPGGTQ